MSGTFYLDFIFNRKTFNNLCEEIQPTAYLLTENHQRIILQCQDYQHWPRLTIFGDVFKFLPTEQRRRVSDKIYFLIPTVTNLDLDVRILKSIATSREISFGLSEWHSRGAAHTKGAGCFAAEHGRSGNEVISCSSPSRDGEQGQAGSRTWSWSNGEEFRCPAE